MSLATLDDLLVHELKDLYSAEKMLLKALPKMAKAAADPDLKNAFQSHLEETRGHVERLDRIVQILGVSPRGSKCEAMEGLIKEGEELLEEDAPPEVLDAGLIAAAQRVEHYEMAGYGCARAFALQLGQDDVAAILQETLDEESAANEKLTSVAEQSVNPAAMDAADQEQEPVAAGGRKGSRR